MKLSKDVRMVPFKAEDAIDLFNSTVSEDVRCLPFSWQQMQANELSGPAYTGIYKDVIVAVGGVTMPWPGRGIAWALFSSKTDKLGLSLLKYARLYLGNIIRACDLSRVEAYVQVGFPKGEKFVQHMGFKRESEPMINFCEGKDFLMYVMSKGE